MSCTVLSPREEKQWTVTIGVKNDIKSLFSFILPSPLLLSSVLLIFVQNESVLVCFYTLDFDNLLLLPVNGKRGFKKSFYFKSVVHRDSEGAGKEGKSDDCPRGEGRGHGKGVGAESRGHGFLLLYCFFYFLFLRHLLFILTISSS